MRSSALTIPMKVAVVGAGAARGYFGGRLAAIPLIWSPPVSSGRSADPARILNVSPDEESEEREVAPELDFLASLSVEQRFQFMFQRSRVMEELLDAHGHPRIGTPGASIAPCAISVTT